MHGALLCPRWLVGHVQVVISWTCCVITLLHLSASECKNRHGQQVLLVTFLDHPLALHQLRTDTSFTTAVHTHVFAELNWLLVAAVHCVTDP